MSNLDNTLRDMDMWVYSFLIFWCGLCLIGVEALEYDKNNMPLLYYVGGGLAVMFGILAPCIELLRAYKKDKKKTGRKA